MSLARIDPDGDSIVCDDCGAAVGSVYRDGEWRLRGGAWAVQVLFVCEGCWQQRRAPRGDAVV